MRKPCSIRLSILIATIVALIGLTPTAFAAKTGDIEGVITNADSGDPIAGASVILEGTAIRAVSDSTGVFIIGPLRPGLYTLTASANSFSDEVIRDIDVIAGRTTIRDIQLSPHKESAPDMSSDIPKAIADELMRLKSGRSGEAVSAIAVPEVTADGRKKSGNQDNGRLSNMAPPSLVPMPQDATKTEISKSPTKRYAAEERKWSEGDSYFEAPAAENELIKRRKPWLPRPVPRDPGDWPEPDYWYSPHNYEHGPFTAMFFRDYGINPFVETRHDNQSTFAVDVDDASFTLTRSYLERGYLPPEEAVRIEEMINHFDYGYRAPRHGVFSVNMEAVPSYFGRGSQLLRIGIKGMELDDRERQVANLVFLIDVSGSMSSGGRLEMVKDGLHFLVDNLEPEDKVGIVVFNTGAQVVIEPSTIRYRERLHRAIDNLYPSGSTNAEAGLRLAYQMAERHFDRNRINRIILCSDGVANTGRTNPDELLRRIKRFADRGITLTTVGVGMGNHNDYLLEKLGDQGNGQYAYIDSIEEARRLFVEKLTGMLQVIARDVKIQVEFDPQVVYSYRLIGYENRDVADHQFRNDRVDGGEIGAGHQVTALYELVLTDNHRNRRAHPGTVFIRYKDIKGDDVNEINAPITQSLFVPRFEQGSPAIRLAAAAAEFGEILKDSYWARGSSLSEVSRVTREAAAEMQAEEVDEFLQMIRTAQSLKERFAGPEW